MQWSYEPSPRRRTGKEWAGIIGWSIGIPLLAYVFLAISQDITSFLPTTALQLGAADLLIIIPCVLLVMKNRTVSAPRKRRCSSKEIAILVVLSLLGDIAGDAICMFSSSDVVNAQGVPDSGADMTSGMANSLFDKVDYQTAANDEDPVDWEISSVFIAPVAEELLFRGVIYGFGRRLSVVAAFIWSALVFGAGHFDSDNPGLFPMALLFGFSQCFVYEMTGRVWVGIIVHVFCNSTIGSLIVSPAIKLLAVTPVVAWVSYIVMFVVTIIAYVKLREVIKQEDAALEIQQRVAQSQMYWTWMRQRMGLAPQQPIMAAYGQPGYAQPMQPAYGQPAMGQPVVPPTGYATPQTYTNQQGYGQLGYGAHGYDQQGYAQQMYSQPGYAGQQGYAQQTDTGQPGNGFAPQGYPVQDSAWAGYAAPQSTYPQSASSQSAFSQTAAPQSDETHGPDSPDGWHPSDPTQ
ncbi:MAG: CPBP family glutamic-type intramembrane protease [Bifidobacteriaceae bacterium]|nr:CPBP family glutamic-type intramembrane protease [Bifidobacteriaceae bacterium]